MISFDNLQLDPGTLLLLSKIDIDFAFQPIFHISTGSIFAYKSLIDPNESTVKDIVEQCEVSTKLHILELATLFGSVKRFLEHGKSENLCINSFASEILTPHESQVFFEDVARTLRGRLVIVLMNHNFFSPLTWQIKRNQLRSQNASIVLDDFSPNFDHLPAFNVFEPDYVKLDRCYIENIRNSNHRDKIDRIVEFYHSYGAKVMIEGIETAEEYEYIKHTHIDFAQGNYLGKPI